MRCVYAIHHPAVFSILIAAANITSMISKKLAEYSVTPSKSGKENCYDNAVVETFFKSLKAEML